MTDYDKKRRLEALLRQKELLKKELPHLYLFKWYHWAWQFFKSTNPVTLLCAANQISKSSTQIRKCVEWATNQKLWDKLWSTKPNLFWYFYPSKDVATVEFEKKWKLFLPQGSMKGDRYYGWKEEKDGRNVKAIHFNSGVSVYFKTYAQSVHTLQSSSVYCVFCDEELPVDYYDELMLRTAATGGYFSMVFTATMGQELWWRAMECQGKDIEAFPEATKIQVSMYDCLTYKDGSPGPWTIEKIKQVEQRCKSKNEILRRVYGRFVKDEGKKYHAFDPSKHFIPECPPPQGWNVYAGVDIGSGGRTGHPSAIVFVAVSPNCKKGIVFKGWRGDDVETTAGDVIEKYDELEIGLSPVLKWYDFASKDFGTIQQRLGKGFSKAEKSHELGENILNTLFKNDMLKICDTDQLRKLGSEMLNLDRSTPKTKAKDDFCDALRYATVNIPWDFSGLELKSDILGKVHEIKKELTHEEAQIMYRRGIDPYETKDKEGWDEFEGEFDYWNKEYGN